MFSKRGLRIVIAIALLFFGFIIFISQNESLSLTGATIREVLYTDSKIEISPVTLPENGSGFLESTELSPHFDNLSTQEQDFPSLKAQANCVAWPCNCEDIINESVTITMTSDLNCTDEGIILNASNITFDCNGYNIIGPGNGTNNGIDIAYYNLTVSYNTTIKNCNIDRFYKGITIGSNSPVNKVFIINNFFYNNSHSGVYVTGANTINVNISNNLFQNNSVGIYLENTSNNSVNNNWFKQNNKGITLATGNNTIFTFNNFTNNTYGYYIRGSSNYFIEDELINNTQAIYYYLDDSVASYNNNFTNVKLVNNLGDINLTSQRVLSNATFINITLNKSKIYTSAVESAFFRWYVLVNITDAANSPLSNVTIEGYNSLGLLDYSDQTNGNGTVTLILHEYYQKGTVNYYLVPHTIKAFKNNYTENSTSINLLNTTGATINLTLSAISCGSNVSSNIYLGNNFSCSGNGLTINSDNIIIDGNNHRLIGNGSGVGINLTGKKNVTILDLIITNFTKALSFYGSNNSNLTNIALINNTGGIVLNNSNNNNIYESVIGNNTLYDVHAASSGGTNTSLINTTVNLDNITVAGNANVFLKWYVDVNATYNDIYELSNANITGYFNSTGEFDNYVLTAPIGGYGRPILTELKKNSSGISYLTPHNVTLTYSSSLGTVMNSSTFNLTQKKANNIRIDLGVTLDCTAPSNSLELSGNVALCPGIFEDYITIDNNNANVTCVQTVFFRSSQADSYAITITANNITLNDCLVENLDVKLDNVQRFTITGLNISFGDIHLYYARNGTLKNFRSGVVGLYSFNSNITILNGTFRELRIEGYSNNNLIINNTLNIGQVHLDGTAYNNYFYYNNFSSIGTFAYTSGDTINNNNNFNTSVAGYAQGNAYSDYCDTGSDTNGAGYADNVSSAGTSDWPYNSTTSTKISEAISGMVVDYGPKIQTCPAADVFLGGSSSGGGGASAGASASPAAPAAVAPTPTGAVSTPKATPEETYTSEEAKLYLKTENVKVNPVSEGIVAVSVTLENTGDKKMSLFPELNQKTEEPFFIVTRKTLGYESSLLRNISNLAYSSNSVAGRLLEAKIINPEQIILNPGDKIEKKIEIKEGLVAPKEIKIQFTTLGSTVVEKDIEIEKKAFSVTAVDLDNQNKLVDVYAVIVPEEATAKLEEYYKKISQELLTGGAITDFLKIEGEEYLLELSINKGKKTLFADLYGPYNLKLNQTFIFAQQIKLDQKFKPGIYEVKTRIYRKGRSLVENSFELEVK